MVSTQPKIQHIWKMIAPWPTQDLITLAELKTQLRIDQTDTTRDEELQLIIDGVSSQMARFANRGWTYGFGYHEVQETFWNCVDEDRIYFSIWPVKLADIQSITLAGADILPGEGTDWVLEEMTGTLFRPNSPWNGTVDAHYKGGYKIPDETPADLKRACGVASREDYYTYIRGSVLSGVRMISHKHARVQYSPPGQLAATQAGAFGPANLGPTWNAVMNVLNKYIRHWM